MLRPVSEVFAELLSDVSPVATSESRTLDAALGCCLASDVTSDISVPPADNSAMDGYAIALASVAEGQWLRVSDRIPAGSTGSALEAGTAARIFTGAPIPQGADTVVIQEDTEAREGEVKITEMPESGANVRPAGQDVQAGSVVVAAGSRLSPEAIGLIASVGVSEVEVKAPLRVAILSTGDELVEPGGQLEPGQIFNSNRYVLAGLLRQMGMTVIDLGIVEDTPEATEAALRRAADEADCVLTTGGVSVGEEDHVKGVVEKLGHLQIWKLAIKPGKPLAYGRVLGVPFFGLPGNPVSTFVTFLVLARPYLLAMQGLTDTAASMTEAIADFEFRAGKRQEYLRVQLDSSSDNTVAQKFPNQGSGVLTSVVWADGLAVVDPGRHVQPGDRLSVLRLR